MKKIEKFSKNFLNKTRIFFDNLTLILESFMCILYIFCSIAPLRLLLINKLKSIDVYSAIRVIILCMVIFAILLTVYNKKKYIYKFSYFFLLFYLLNFYFVSSYHLLFLESIIFTISIFILIYFDGKSATFFQDISALQVVNLFLLDIFTDMASKIIFSFVNIKYNSILIVFISVLVYLIIKTFDLYLQKHVNIRIYSIFVDILQDIISCILILIFVTATFINSDSKIGAWIPILLISVSLFFILCAFWKYFKINNVFFTFVILVIVVPIFSFLMNCMENMIGNYTFLKRLFLLITGTDGLILALTSSDIFKLTNQFSDKKELILKTRLFFANLTSLVSFATFIFYSKDSIKAFIKDVCLIMSKLSFLFQGLLPQESIVNNSFKMAMFTGLIFIFLNFFSILLLELEIYFYKSIFSKIKK